MANDMKIRNDRQSRLGKLSHKGLSLKIELIRAQMVKCASGSIDQMLSMNVKTRIKPSIEAAIAERRSLKKVAAEARRAADMNLNKMERELNE